MGVHCNVRLWIVGDGIEKQKILDLVGRLKLANKISFLGVRSDVAKIYNAADMAVFPVFCLGRLRLVVAEAMVTEKVVVATDCGGVKEVVGDCGYLVPIKDPVALGAAMKNALLLSPDEKIKFGRGGESSNYSKLLPHRNRQRMARNLYILTENQWLAAARRHSVLCCAQVAWMTSPR